MALACELNVQWESASSCFGESILTGRSVLLIYFLFSQTGLVVVSMRKRDPLIGAMPL